MQIAMRIRLIMQNAKEGSGLTLDFKGLAELEGMAYFRLK
jgi:hypothetical protein